MVKREEGDGCDCCDSQSDVIGKGASCQQTKTHAPPKVLMSPQTGLNLETARDGNGMNPTQYSITTLET